MRTLAVVTIAFLTASCGTSDLSWSVPTIEFTGAPGSGEPHLVATGDGGALLSWLEPAGGERYALKVARRSESGWSDAVTVRETDLFFVNWADFPSVIELADGSWMVHWLEKVSPATYAYHVAVAISHDQGSTWSDPIAPHRDDSPTEHGFVSMMPWGEDRAAVTWLDGRAMDASAELGRQGAMTVRFTTIASDGTLGEEVLLDDRTCECCTTSLARTSGGMIAAYRDRSMEEIRDIAVVRYANGEWTDPVHVGNDQWHYPGCPVNGPQLSARGDTVAIAWFTAPDQMPRVQVAFSTDGGATFGEPTRVDEGRPSGRVDVELLDDGTALVSWLELVDPDAEVRARRVHSTGVVDASWVVSTTREARGSGFPRMTRVGKEILFAWRLLGPDGGVRVAAATLQGRSGTYQYGR